MFIAHVNTHICCIFLLMKFKDKLGLIYTPMFNYQQKFVLSKPSVNLWLLFENGNTAKKKQDESTLTNT